MVGLAEGDAARSVSCRIVSAVTGPDDLSRLYPGLIHRISGMRIVLSLLREREGDIPLLLAHFLSEKAATYERESFHPSPRELARTGFDTGGSDLNLNAPGIHPIQVTGMDNILGLSLQFRRSAIGP